MSGELDKGAVSKLNAVGYGAAKVLISVLYGAIKGVFIGAAIVAGPGTVVGLLAGMVHGFCKGIKAYNKDRN